MYITAIGESPMCSLKIYFYYLRLVIWLIFIISPSSVKTRCLVCEVVVSNSY